MSSVAMETEKVPAPGGAPAEEDQLREDFDHSDGAEEHRSLRKCYHRDTCYHAGCSQAAGMAGSHQPPATTLLSVS